MIISKKDPLGHAEIIALQTTKKLNTMNLEITNYM